VSTADVARFRRGVAGPLVWGHRGASARAPENTLAAFALALAEGADGVELDVRRCATGEVVVLHDPTLLRTAGDPRAVREVPLPALRRLDAGRGECVPLLDEVIDVVVGSGRLLNVEVKADGDDRAGLARAVAESLARRTAAERAAIAVSTFDPRMVIGLRRAGLGVPLLFLCEDTRQGRLLGRAVPPLLGTPGINPEHVLVTPARMARWRARGLVVTPWTVDDPARIRALAAAGVDGLITNDPAGTRRALAVGADRARSEA
jgi:glycerophosphoryl diester phosphodiesterase